MRMPARQTRPPRFAIRMRVTDGQVRPHQKQMIELTFDATSPLPIAPVLLLLAIVALEVTFPPK
jgi:aromatic ring-cleaving dioxygenase